MLLMASSLDEAALAERIGRIEKRMSVSVGSSLIRCRSSGMPSGAMALRAAIGSGYGFCRVHCHWPARFREYSVSVTPRMRRSAGGAMTRFSESVSSTVITMLSFSRISPIWPSVTESVKPVKCLAVGDGPRRICPLAVHRGMRRKISRPSSIVVAATRSVGHHERHVDQAGVGVVRVHRRGRIFTSGGGPSRSDSRRKKKRPNVQREASPQQSSRTPTWSLWLT